MSRQKHDLGERKRRLAAASTSTAITARDLKGYASALVRTGKASPAILGERSTRQGEMAPLGEAWGRWGANPTATTSATTTKESA